jgi:hypothetical protein
MTPAAAVATSEFVEESDWLFLQDWSPLPQPSGSKPESTFIAKRLNAKRIVDRSHSSSNRARQSLADRSLTESCGANSVTGRVTQSFITATPAQAQPSHEQERRLRGFVTRVLVEADAAGFTIDEVIGALCAYRP